MMLDCGDCIFVCVGDDAPAGEKKDCMIKSQNFLMADDAKPNYTPMHRVKTGQNPNKESWTKAFDAAAVAATAAATPSAEEATPPEPAAAEPEPAAAAEPAGDGTLHPLAALQGGCPKGVDAAHKEKSLADDDFEAQFKMPRGDFDGLPKWKKDKAKKDAGIF